MSDEVAVPEDLREEWESAVGSRMVGRKILSVDTDVYITLIERIGRPEQQSELTLLAVEIADESAFDVLNSYCLRVSFIGYWFVTSGGSKSIQNKVQRAVQYLDLKGELEHHPDDHSLVRKRKP